VALRETKCCLCLILAAIRATLWVQIRKYLSFCVPLKYSFQVRSLRRYSEMRAHSVGVHVCLFFSCGLVGYMNTHISILLSFFVTCLSFLQFGSYAICLSACYCVSCVPLLFVRALVKLVIKEGPYLQMQSLGVCMQSYSTVILPKDFHSCMCGSFH